MGTRLQGHTHSYPCTQLPIHSNPYTAENRLPIPDGKRKHHSYPYTVMQLNANTAAAHTRQEHHSYPYQDRDTCRSSTQTPQLPIPDRKRKHHSYPYQTGYQYRNTGNANTTATHTQDRDTRRSSTQTPQLPIPDRNGYDSQDITHTATHTQ